MKKRHIKTFPEKFGIRSDRDEFEQFRWNHRKKQPTREQLDSVPCMGHFYLDFGKSSDWWNDLETATLDRLLRCNVLEVSPEYVIFFYYDDHHHDISVCVRKHKGYFLKGNVLIMENK